MIIMKKVTFRWLLHCGHTGTISQNLKKPMEILHFWYQNAISPSGHKGLYTYRCGPSWGRLGRPKREPREAKIEVGWVFFRAWKGMHITSCFWMPFWSIWDPLGEAKMSISCGRGCKNQLLRKLNVDIVFRPVLGGFGRPSWGQVGAKLAHTRVQNVMWKLLQC